MLACDAAALVHSDAQHARMQSFMAFSNTTQFLTNVLLDGCFLVSDAAFQRFFIEHPLLERVSLSSARKLGPMGVDALVHHCLGNLR